MWASDQARSDDADRKWDVPAQIDKRAGLGKLFLDSG